MNLIYIYIFMSPLTLLSFFESYVSWKYSFSNKHISSQVGTFGIYNVEWVYFDSAYTM